MARADRFLGANVRWSMGDETPQGQGKRWTAVAEFILVMKRQVAKQALALGRQFDQDFATVFLTAPTMGQAGSLEAVDKLDGTVML
jgi:hypothetical protein